MTELPKNERLWAETIAESKREEQRLQRERKEHFEKLADIGYQPKSNIRQACEIVAIGVGAGVATAALIASGTALSRVYKKQPVFGYPLLNSAGLVTSSFVGGLGLLHGSLSIGTYEEARYWGAQEQLKKLEKAEQSKSL